MANEDGSGKWTALAAIGGILSGVAAVVTLFVSNSQTAKPVETVAAPAEQAAAPDLETPPEMRVLYDPQQAVGGVVPDAAAPPQQDSLIETIAAPASVAPVSTTPGTAATLMPGVTVSLVSVAERRDRFIATLRFENTSGNDIGVAVQRAGAFEADFIMSDGLGGSCQMISNGEGWGSLDSAEVNPAFQGGSNPFRAVASGGGGRHTIFFNKGRCASSIDPRAATVSISGAFVLDTPSGRRAIPVSFDDIQPVR